MQSICSIAQLLRAALSRRGRFAIANLELAVLAWPICTTRFFGTAKTDWSEFGTGAPFKAASVGR